eukprot:TRINITY_DN75_c0_g2_i7.p2 TRINITY_DN75_c0_g2~~TRINITY_DN75_c0_g2_i7.p2  ORF type:complete len:419 (-),score=147.54 TRINITY_DN75_c0_g2_i7:42-1298(-)
MRFTVILGLVCLLVAGTTAQSAWECGICELTLGYVENYLSENSTEAEVESFLENSVCALVAPISSLCDLFVESYLPRAVAFLDSDLPPDVFCADIDLCAGNSTTVLSEEEYRNAFVNFMQTHKKSYASHEFHKRYSIFKANLDFINAHNAAKKGFSVAVNEYADLTGEEFKAIYNGLKSVPHSLSKVVVEADVSALPASVDWRAKGAVSSIKNQGQCGSCWSFSTTGSVEGGLVLQGGKSIVGLSEQNLMDCSDNYGNMGCNGGLMDNAFQYIIANGGVDTEASYPYTAADGTCHYSSSNCGATISGYQDIPSGSESSLQTSVANVGPISIAIDASHSSFQFYSSGVYYEPACSSSQLDHGVLAVGYGTSSGSEYWLVKNSWGTGWGLSGYIMMARNRGNNCGVATSASYPTGTTTCN